MSMEAIIKQAMELGSAIAESEAVRNLQLAQTRLTEDSEAYATLLQYQEAQMQLEQQLNDGGSIDPAEEQRIDELEKKLTDNALMQALIQAQEGFDSLMQGVYFAINQMISGGSCAGGCEGCSADCG